MRHPLALLCAGALLLPISAAADDRPRESAQLPAHRSWTPADTAYVLDELHKLNLHELEVGELARRRGAAEAVKAYARMLVGDHQAAEEQIAALARRKGIGLTDQRSPPLEKESGHLRMVTPAHFDRAFLRAMILTHQKALESATRWRRETDDFELHGALDALLPRLEYHLKEARWLADE